MKTVPIPVSSVEEDAVRIWLKTGKLDRLIISMRVEADHLESSALEEVNPIEFVKSTVAELPFELPTNAKNQLHDAFRLRVAIEELEKFQKDDHPIYGMLQIEQ